MIRKRFLEYFKIVALFIMFFVTNISFSTQTNEIKKVLDIEIIDAVGDNYGFLWIVSKNSFYKYDGDNLILIKKWTVKEFKPYKIKLIKNKIFISSKNDGVLSYDIIASKIEIISKIKGIIDFYITKNNHFFLCADKSLIVVNLRGNVLKITFNNSQYNPNFFYSNITYYKRQLYITIPFEGIFKLENNKIREIPINFGKEYLNGVLSERDGDLCFINKSFIDNDVIQENNILKFGSNNKLRVDNLLKNKIINDYIKKENNIYSFDSKGFIYLNGIEIFKLDNAKNNTLKFKFLKVNDKIYFYDKKCLFEIQDNNSEQEKVIKSIKESFYGDSRSRRKIIVSNDSIFFFGNPNPILYHKGIFKFLGKYKNSVYDALKVDNDYFLATEGSGLLITDLISYEKKINLHTEEKYFTALMLDNKNLYIGGIDYLYKYNTLSNFVQKYKNPFSGHSIKTIKKLDFNNLIVGTDNGLYIQNLKTLKSKKIANLNGNIIGDILIGNRKIYIGHENGIDVLSSNLNLINNLNFPLSENPRICSLDFNSKGHIVASSYTGVFIHNLQNNKTVYLTQKNGLVNEEYNYKSFAKINDDTFIFGGLDGYDLVNTSSQVSMKKSKAKLYSGFDKIQSSGFTHYNFIKDEISFNRDKEYLKIYFSPDILDSNDYHINVILNNDTIETNNNYFNLIGLKEGKYDFKVFVTKNNDKIEFPNIKINVTESFLKSKMFIVLISLVIIITLTFTVLSIIKLKLDQKKAFQKISMDLHDDIGGLLCKAKLIIGNNELNDTKKNMLIKFIDQANFNLRIFINNIESKKRLLNDIEYQIHEIFNEDLLLEKNCKLELLFNLSQNYYIKSNLYRDIKFILYEVSNNFFKHSKSDKISIEFVVHAKELSIHIIECSNQIKAIDFNNNSGFGLKNIEKRVNRNDGNLRMDIDDTSYRIFIKFKI